MNPIYIHFASFSQNIDSQTYIGNTLECLHKYYLNLGGESIKIENNHLDELADILATKSDSSDLKITDAKDFPALDDFHMNQINMIIDCAKEIMKEVAPLLSGEKIEQSISSYLSENWKSFGKGCGVIKRVTNFATVYFLFPNTMVGQDGQLNKEAPIFPNKNNQTQLRNNIESQEPNLITKAPYDSFVL